jgi:subtilisin family serine protease
MRARFRVAAPLVLATLLLVPTAATTSAAGRGRPVDGGRAWTDRGADQARLVVIFKADTTRAQAREIEHDGLELADFERGTRRAVYQTSHETLRSEQRRLERDSAVRSVQVSHRLYRDLDPRDEELWSYLWGIDNTGQEIDGVPGEPDVDIDGRESLGAATGSGVVVAVIDDGVDFSQPDLAGQAWVNPGESGSGRETNNVDDDGNGYIDDVNGWDFCHDDKTVHDVDDDFHGTHVTGTIAAKLDGIGVVGVAPAVKIMALKFLGDDPACGWDDQAIEAIAYAKSFGVRISNNSWGRSASPVPGEDALLRNAIADSGMLFIASAGNSGVNNDTSSKRSVPASFDLPNIISVAAVDNQGFLAGFSNYGATSVDVAAPGVNIASTFPDYGVNEAGYYYLSGTSMASPHVSGIAALVGAQSPSLLNSPTDLKARILDRAKPDDNIDGLLLTGDIASAANSIDGTPPTVSMPNSYTFLTGGAIGSAIKTRVRWSAGTDDLSGVASYAVRQSVNAAAFTTVTASTTSLYVDRSLGFSKSYRYRVRAQDHAGNNGAYVDGPQVTPKLTQQNGSGVTYGGSWTKRTSSSASGGSTRSATAAGAWVQFSFTGRAVAVIGPKGSTRGSVKAYVDGTYVGSFSEYRSSSQSKIVLFARTWGSNGSHKVKLVLRGTSGHPRFDIDAFASIVQTAP